MAKMSFSFCSSADPVSESNSTNDMFEKLKGSTPQWETLLKACQALRQEQDEQAKHVLHLDTHHHMCVVVYADKQDVALAQAERNLAAGEQKLRELKRDVPG
eukprot:gene35382-40111_t